MQDRQTKHCPLLCRTHVAPQYFSHRACVGKAENLRIISKLASCRGQLTPSERNNNAITPPPLASCACRFARVTSSYQACPVWGSWRGVLWGATWVGERGPMGAVESRAPRSGRPPAVRRWRSRRGLSNCSSCAVSRAATSVSYSTPRKYASSALAACCTASTTGRQGGGQQMIRIFVRFLVQNRKRNKQQEKMLGILV